jgi:hypothetical protein
MENHPATRALAAGHAGLVRLVAHPLVPVLAVALLSRLVATAILLGADPAGSPIVGGVEGPLLIHDGSWYLAIVLDGYHPYPLELDHPNFAFFPLWPAAIVVASLFGVFDPTVVAPVLSNALFVGGSVVVFELLRRHVGTHVSQRTTMLLALAPGAAAFSLAYSESLFILIAAGALVVGVTSRAGVVLVFLASICRLVGPALSLAALPELRMRRRAALAALVAGPVGFLLWAAFIWHLTGDPLGYLRGTPSWWSSLGASTGLESVVATFAEGVPFDIVACTVTCALAVVMVGGALALLRSSPALALYSLGVLAPTLLAGHWVNWPRLMLPAFPALVLLARRRTVFLAAAPLFGLGQVALARWYAAGVWTP